MNRNIEASPLYNPDLAPTNASHRTWGTYNYAALWVSMSVNILTYMLAASMIQGGMNWKQALLTVFVGNAIVLAFLGPVAGIMICDYFVIRRRVLQVDDLYLRGGAYEYSRGVNWRAVLALLLGAWVALIGLVVPSLRTLYDYSWLVGFAASFITYYAMMQSQRAVALNTAAEAQES